MTDIYTDFAPDCDAIAPLLVALADNELPERDAAQARHHLETCAACRETFDGNAQVRAAAQAWSVDGASGRDLWDGVQARITAEAGETPAPAAEPAPVAPGFITAEQLAHAMYVSKTRGGAPTEEPVSEHELATERDLAEAWAIRENIPFVDLAKHPPKASAIEVLPASFLHAAGALPCHKDGNRLWVVFRDPRDTKAIDAVRMASGCRVQPMHAAPSDLARAMAQAYPLVSPPAPDTDAANAPATDTTAPQEIENGASVALQELRVEIAALRAETATLRREVARLRAQTAPPASLPQRRFDLYAPSPPAPLDVSARVQ